MVTDVLGADIRLFNNDIQFGNNQDFAITSGTNNLRQAILTRLQTAKGEFYNTFYGSDLYKSFGFGRTELLRSRISGFVFETLLQEPRIGTIKSINITFDNDNIHKINVNIIVIPISTNIPLNLVFPLFVGGQ